ncbi:flagellar motor switch protein FliM [Nocardioides scoriae]|uniref:Flagellar motor switch protein FliM n=1 Tax=Nocardioides scoriae TaxID=642780 RepID=A0A1H1S824_9ACTN|nr:flagellar motor switch protein FliM [Nocardioides scoriae]SDS44071.1 flagellar motor switch protein FliM [Nocardioides scoriae]
MTSSAPGVRSPHATRRQGRTGERPVAAYDFRRPIQLSREHARALQLAFDEFARQAGAVFSSTLRRVSQVSADLVEQRTYAEYAASVPSSTCLTLFRAEPLPGLGVLEIPTSAAMTCVDHMLGGAGGPQPDRPLSDIEESVFSGLTSRLLTGLTASLQEIVPLEPEVTGVEYNPQFAQVGAPSDTVVVAVLHLRLDAAEFRFTVCLPFSGLLPFLRTAVAPAPVSERERADRARSEVLLREQFDTIPVEVGVRFRPTTISPDVLDDLCVGDVIRLGHPSGAPLDVVTDATSFAHATAGTKGTRLAALIVAASLEDR